MKRKFTFHPKDYAIGQIEKYYSDMAAKGWHLEYRNIFTSSFLQGEPKDMKYRVEVASPKAFDSTRLPEEQVAVYEDCGWEYVDCSGFIHVFRAPEGSDAPEFYLEPEQQAATLKGLRKQRLRQILEMRHLKSLWMQQDLLPVLSLQRTSFARKERLLLRVPMREQQILI